MVRALLSCVYLVKEQLQKPSFPLLTWITGTPEWPLSLLSSILSVSAPCSQSILEFKSAVCFFTSSASSASLWLSSGPSLLAFRASSCSRCFLSSSATVPLKVFSLVLMSLIWTLALSTCSLSPRPSWRRPWATTFTSSHEACFSRPLLSVGKPTAACTKMVTRRMRSWGIFIFVGPIWCQCCVWNLSLSVVCAAHWEALRLFIALVGEEEEEGAGKVSQWATWCNEGLNFWLYTHWCRKMTCLQF